ncbi:MAG: ribosome-associated translation inhibitor RaiA [Thermanaeromonas sp.]|uniref:ribosome hibernation-promoting factor, HPF/YfiA family n=1 Tax=Thermanaeromonas sp. TaxID=2003697 RepID=UPI00243D7A05|nr:ribosome-associated translation inhibitor RaiA [Thermanaeromonas sp.]MCG0278287.1 ribosome-associated translation inhibitor RaiA [Thermanaeromonas sp.]
MHLVIQGRNFEVPHRFHQYAEKRLKKLERLLDDEDIEVQVTVSANRGRYTVEATVFVEGYIMRGEETAETTHSAVDLVLEKLERQVEKYKTRLIKKKRARAGEREERAAGRPPEEGEEREEQKVVKVKRFPVKPMTVEEAIMQMELLGHDFFVFANAETEKVSVLYRRRDGQYGLIEPELD